MVPDHENECLDSEKAKDRGQIPKIDGNGPTGEKNGLEEIVYI